MTATTGNSPQYRRHPLSAAFPLLPEQELEALAYDIEQNGQREAGVLFEGMVLDGWNRYLGCEKAGVEFRAAQFNGEDPALYVLSKNLHRRHMNASQRAAAMVAVNDWRGQSGSAAAADSPMKTSSEMARDAEVSPRTIEYAKTAHSAGLGEVVLDGSVSAERAAEIAKLPPAKRARAVKAIKEGTAPKTTKKHPEDVDKLHVRISALETRLGETKEALAEMTDLASAARAFEEKQEFKEMQVLRVELRSCKRRRDELMAENAELKKEVARWKKRADKK